jgi:hypothetical protein
MDATAFLRFLSANNIVQDSCLDGSGRGFNDYTGPPRKEKTVEKAVSDHKRLSKFEKKLERMAKDLDDEMLPADAGRSAAKAIPAAAGVSAAKARVQTGRGGKGPLMKRQSADIKGGKTGNEYGEIEQNVLTVDLGMDYDVDSFGRIEEVKYPTLWTDLDFEQLPTTTLEDIIPKLKIIVSLREKATKKHGPDPGHTFILESIETACENAEKALKEADPSQDVGKAAALKAVQMKTYQERFKKVGLGSSDAFDKNTELLGDKISNSSV